MKTLKYLALAAALGLAVGCDDDEPAPVVTTDAAPTDAPVSTPDGGVPPKTDAPTTGTPDGGGGADAGAPDTGPAALTLVGWVDDLVVNHTTATSDPDTVEDKNITDTDDPAAFDPLLAK